MHKAEKLGNFELLSPCLPADTGDANLLQAHVLEVSQMGILCGMNNCLPKAHYLQQQQEKIQSAYSAKLLAMPLVRVG